MITIKELAKILNVSPTTVSNVVNGRVEKMSPETRKKIEAALVEYHYVNKVREDEPAKELKLISVDFFLGEKKSVLTDPFCANFLDTLMQTANKDGRHIIVGTPDHEDEILNKLSARNIEGAIIVGYSSDKCSSLQKRTAKPVIFIDSGEGDFDSISLDDEQGTYDMTTYLIRQGHKKIAFFYDHGGQSASSTKRFQGFLRAMNAHDLPYSKEDRYFLPADKHMRFEILRQFALTKAKTTYTAAIFVSDLYASEAINCFFSQGISVPDDISISGFDDNIYARLSRPQLTTIRQHPEDKAIQAWKMLKKRIYGEPLSVHSLHLPTELIVRDSIRHI